MKKSPFEVPLTFRVRYWLSSHRWLLAAKRLVIPPIVVVALFVSFALFPFLTQAFKDAGTAAVFGIALGAILTWLISHDVQLKQFQAEAAIAKKKTIYEPIYSELLRLKRSIEREPYPLFFDVEPGRPEGYAIPRFVEWTQAKRDSRHIQVPQWVAAALDAYVAELEEYRNARAAASDAFGNRLAQIIHKNTGHTYSIEDIDSETLTAVVLEDEDTFWHRFSLDERREAISQERPPEVWNAVLAEYRTLDEVRQWREFYEQSVMGHMTWLTQVISKIIKHIGVRYEAQGDIF